MLCTNPYVKIQLAKLLEVCVIDTSFFPLSLENFLSEKMNESIREVVS